MSQALSRDSEPQVRAYIEAKLADEESLEAIRDEIYTETGVSKDYRKSAPHLTIIPPFTIPESNKQRVNRLLKDSDLIGRTIPINGVGVWPSIQNPRVILLDTPVDIQTARTELIHQLKAMGAVDMEDPVCPHITLFKTDNGYAQPDTLKTAIQETIWENREKTPEWTTTIQYVDFTVITRLADE